MNYFKLVVFCSLCELKKGALVSQKLGITPSTVSFHLHSLEEELGMQLFYKRMGNYVLTSQGEGIYHYASRIVGLQQELQQFAQSNREGIQGTFRIGVSDLANQLFLPKIIDTFTSRYPQVRFSVVANTSPKIEEMLANFQLDYGILIGSPKKKATLSYEELGKDRLTLVYGKDHQFTRKSTIEKSDIMNQKILFHTNQSSTKSVMELWLNYPANELNSIELDSITTIKKVLAYSQTISFVSEFLVQEEVASGLLEQRHLADMGLDRNIYLVQNKEHFDDVMGRNFKELIIEYSQVLKHP